MVCPASEGLARSNGFAIYDGYLRNETQGVVKVEKVGQIGYRKNVASLESLGSDA